MLPVTRSVARVALVLALAAGCSRGSGDVAVNGTVEMRETEVAPQVSGEVRRVLVSEGDVVRPGDTLLLMSSVTVPGEVAARAAQLARARAELEDLRRGARADEIRRAESERRALATEAGRLARDAQRTEALLADSIISRQQADQVRAAARQAADRADAAASSSRLVRDGPRQGAVDAARARVAEAEAALATARAAAAELAVVAPEGGVVTVRAAEPGEVLAPGQPALVIADQRRPWVRVYVNQRDLPFVRLGATVEVRLDGAPDRPLAGRVTAVSPRAEFTPRVALTEEERADMVFGVKVALEDPSGLLKAGLPVTVRFRRATQETSP
ncbi:MAG: HlyD family secretion protein [Gemmatimonadaceae bacterium]